MKGPIVVKGLSDQEAMKIAREELAKVGLSDRETHYPRHLSGGTEAAGGLSQGFGHGARCSFAGRAAPPQPWTLSWSEKVEKSIAYAAKSGQTMVLVSHDMSFVAQVADRGTHFWTRGRIIESGTPEEDHASSKGRTNQGVLC